MGSHQPSLQSAPARGQTRTDLPINEGRLGRGQSRYPNPDANSQRSVVVPSQPRGDRWVGSRINLQREHSA